MAEYGVGIANRFSLLDDEPANKRSAAPRKPTSSGRQPRNQGMSGRAPRREKDRQSAGPPRNNNKHGKSGQYSRGERDAQLNKRGGNKPRGERNNDRRNRKPRGEAKEAEGETKTEQQVEVKEEEVEDAGPDYLTFEEVQAAKKKVETSVQVREATNDGFDFKGKKAVSLAEQQDDSPLFSSFIKGGKKGRNRSRKAKNQVSLDEFTGGQKGRGQRGPRRQQVNAPRVDDANFPSLGQRS